ncbi:MAG: Ig-like domain-containing protein, partial [Chitinivibrionales bacterium]|nr:Ig-like domain-containing protein [Chitinivibrionales bacterium]
MPLTKKLVFALMTPAFILSPAALAATAVSAVAGTFATYHIGNSLTQDLMTDFPNVATRYEATLGNGYADGWIFNPSTSLDYLYSNPNVYAATLPASTPWTTAVPGNRWDIITMQPYPQNEAGTQGRNWLIDNINAVNGIIDTAKKNSANASTRFFIYAPWDRTFAGDLTFFSRTYTAATINQSAPDNTPMALSRDVIALFCDRVRMTNPGVCVIPVGEVFFKLDSMMQKGDFDNFTTINQLHRDDYHCNSAGQNVAAWTAYATIFRKSPVGLQNDIFGNTIGAGYTNVTAIDAHDVLLMQQTIWNVVTAMNKYTNVLPTVNVPVMGVSVGPASLKLNTGVARQLTAAITPSDASNQDVTWSSSNTAIATVSIGGLVTGVAAGSATITATTQDGGKTATGAITVSSNSGPEGYWSFNETSGTIAIDGSGNNDTGVLTGGASFTTG